MPEQEQENQTVKTSAALPVSPLPAAPAPATGPLKKSFDVALVDPHDPNIEHFPRVRVTIDAATLTDLTDQQKQPPASGESADAETKRLAFFISEIDRKRAIDAYNQRMGLTGSDLRYDVVPAKDGSTAPTLPKLWIDHLKNIGLLK